ncbi:MAG: hypothetical protein DRQ24_12315 [Candidatus Latescibacterota bacterium]|nr:MAG: hypothetical protein DRQ24_12315 [Candidatus Latescibacterota bacterium]
MLQISTQLVNLMPLTIHTTMMLPDTAYKVGNLRNLKVISDDTIVTLTGNAELGNAQNIVTLPIGLYVIQEDIDTVEVTIASILA